MLEPFKDRYGKPVQRGLYSHIFIDIRSEPTPTNVRFVTGEYVEEKGKRYVLVENYTPENLREHAIHRLGPEDTEKLVPIPESWIEDELKAIIWAKAKLNDLEDKTLDLPLESDSENHIFMGPDVEDSKFPSYSGQYGPNERHAPKQSSPGPVDGFPTRHKKIDIDSAIQGPARSEII
jgi:hypothetical protein